MSGYDVVHHVRTITHRIENVVHELVHVGILRPAASPNGNQDYYLTPHGMRCVEEDTLNLPLLPGSGRADKLLADNPTFPDIGTIVRHYREAIGAYAAKLDLSATVMIVACYEAIENELATAIASYEAKHGKVGSAAKTMKGKSPQEIRERIHDGDYVQAWQVSAVIDDAMPDLERHGMDRQLRTWATRTRAPFVSFTADNRNAAGHPTGSVMDRDEIAARLELLHEHVRRSAAILAFLSR